MVTDEDRERLAAALESASYAGKLGHDGLYRWECEAAADALLPVVQALVAEGQAEALREAAAAAPVVRFNDLGYPVRAVPVSDLLSFASALDPS